MAFLSGRKLSPSSHLNARAFTTSLCATDAFQDATPVLGLREWEWIGECICGFFKRKWLGLQKFLPPTESHWFLQPEVMGNYLLVTGILGFRSSYRAGTPHSWSIPPEFLSTTRACGTSPSSYQSRRSDFLIFIIVRLPFYSISDGSDWWLFYNLVVILIWFWEEVSCVYLC